MKRRTISAENRGFFSILQDFPQRDDFNYQGEGGKARFFLAVDSSGCPAYTVHMAAQLHDDMDYLTDAERLLQSLRALVPHAVALAWTTRALEKDAKAIHVISRTVSDNRLAARIEGLSNRALDIADHLKSSGFFITLARRSLLRSAVLFAQTACLVRAEDPAPIPKLDTLWRSAAGALSDIFRVV